jgi:DNA polymerase V
LFALVDCNNFYASCERVFNPKLEGKPVIILSNNDGCVIARSQEAKDLGIKMGQPYFQLKPLLAENELEVFSSNYPLYGDMSHRVMEVLGGFTPEVEVYSIDEAFLGLHGLVGKDLQAYSRHIRKVVRQYTGIPICIGLGPTKTLAKIANRLAKKDPANEGVLILDTQEKQREALEKTAVEDVWGIGRRYAAKLKKAGITNAWQLSQQRAQWARQQLGGVVGMRLIEELRGVVCLQLDLFPSAKKSIACTRSFGKPVTTLAHLSEAVATYMSRAAEKLRWQQSCVNKMTVFIHTSRFIADTERYDASARITLPMPSNHTGELIHYAHAGLKSIYREGYIYKKAGIILSDLVPSSQIQANVLHPRDLTRGKQLMAILDEVNGKWGRNTLAYASCGTEKEWQTVARMRSPRYTTNWNELLTLNIG